MTIADAPTSVRGHTGGSALGGNAAFEWYSDLTEQVPELCWPQSVRTFALMRHDPQLRAVLSSYFLPIRRAPWQVDGAGCRPEVVQRVADDLGLPIKGQDPAPSGARRRGVSWAEHLRLACTHLIYGHMPFELGATIVGGQARLTSLGERLPQTIDDIETNPDGSLKAIVQHPREAGPAPRINADRLAWYVNEREGASWQGLSLLRPAYATWLIKQEMISVHAVSNRRFGMGVPGFEPQPGANPTPAQTAEAQRMASSVKVAETGGYAAPAGFTFALKGLVGTIPDTLAFIRYLDQQMARQALAGLMDLGDTANGSRALGETFLDLFLLALQAIGDGMAATATTDVAVRIVDWNWGESEPVPAVVCGDVAADRGVTAEALVALLKSGALDADPDLAAAARKWLTDRMTGGSGA